MPGLVAHLLQLDPAALQEATSHPFLSAAATAALPRDQLLAWLAQDRLYAIAATTFLATLLAKLPLPGSVDRRSSREWRTADLLIDCLLNLRRELRLFEDTAAADACLDRICDVAPTRPTRAYQDLFAGAAAPAQPLSVGLTVLWATEMCYLRAWRHARAHLAPPDPVAPPPDMIRRVFIPNWTSPDFDALVRRIGGLLNELGATLAEHGDEWRRCELAFRQVLWAEREFWPDVGDATFPPHRQPGAPLRPPDPNALVSLTRSRLCLQGWDGRWRSSS